MKNEKTRRLVGTALLAAIVVVLQSLSTYFKIGTVELSFVLIPIVVGSAMYGASTGAFLGAVFGVVVLLQPGTNAFYQITVFGTIATVIVKGCASGLLSGLTYKLLKGKNEWLAVYSAAAVCPIVNTAVFVLGLIVFFNTDLFAAFAVFAGVNFAIELIINIVCSPIIIRILHAINRK